MRAGLLVALVLALATGAAAAQPVSPSSPQASAPIGAQKGQSAHPDVAYADYQRGQYAQALRAAMSRVQSNPKDAPAMTLIGQIYLDGFAVPADHAEADRWFALAARLDDPQADFLLGRAYLVGDGVAKDMKKAKSLFLRAAAKDNAGALYNLGVMAIQSDGDFGEAADYFRRAAAAGDFESDYALALLYRSGRGVPADPSKATELLKTAAHERNVDAEVEYGIALFNGDGVAKDEAKAAKYFFRAAQSGNAVAQDRLARMLAAGRGVPKNMVEAMKWHILSRAAGVKDEWLDQKIAQLSPSERAALKDALDRSIGD